MSKPGAKRPLVYIHSASHSGSTLLAQLLARHPEVATVGELSGTVHRARPGYQCSCGVELVQCGFWQCVSSAMAKRGFTYSATTAETDIRNVSSPLARRLLKPLHRGPLLELARDVGMLLAPGGRAHLERQQALKTALVESVMECTGKPVLVDSSKSGVQLKYHLRNPSLEVKAIGLVRDGRGVALSIARNQSTSFPKGARDWRRTNEEAQAIAGRMGGQRWIQVKYETLCEDPQGTLSQLWRFVGVAPRDLDECPAPHAHVLGHGSRLNGSKKIHNSEKWRKELSADDLRTFDAIAGPLNRSLGYR
jgi:hypothetical protein